MTNPINNINRTATDALSNSNAKTKATVSAETGTTKTRPSSEDTVSLSAESSQIKSLQQQLDAVPEVDIEKVDAIKREIAKGNYPLDPERIAENLISLEKALSQ
ncbi:MAG: flagellar biosynthesis anti-sigma factor FlgM [Gammaproteobacteria bacterium]|nr:flagellar biosynthesis anti-sigma factor FlgM [Gammaproteobacteria bacterium]MDH5734951.1 flagellar biosynthesis anti-sigma factor FlgM [Gammaproteobacteria bacterium]